MTLGDKIKEERIKKNLSQQQLGRELNVTQQAIGKWEKNLSEPDTTALIKLSEIFNITVDNILGIKTITPTPSYNSSLNNSLTSEEREILETYRNLPPHRRTTFMLFVKSCNEEITYKDKKQK